MLFSSKKSPVPEVRREINLVPIQDNGRSLLYVHDPYGYAAPDFALDEGVRPLLGLIDGYKSVHDLKPYLGEQLDTDQLLEFIQFLDEKCLLNSSYFHYFSSKTEEEYEAEPIHRAITAGNSYPADPAELTNYLDDAFVGNGSLNSGDTDIKALYAPHIDPRVGMQSYVKAFSSIAHTRPSRIIILATSHYGGLYPEQYDHTPFIVSSKTFELPNARFKPDKAFIDRLVDAGESIGVTASDRAYRLEHSIELHLLFLGHLWNHDCRIVPILVNGFDEMLYMPDGDLAAKVDRCAELLSDALEDEETLFLISGDLAHVGKKFGDRDPARELIESVHHFDNRFLRCGIDQNPTSMLSLMQEELDPYRICGFPPLYTFLKTVEKKGKLTAKELDYSVWDETERQSAVTFGSILYQSENGQ